MNSIKLGTFLSANRFGQILSTILVMGTGVTVAILGAGLVLLWRKLTKATFKSLGLFKPSNLTKTILIGIVTGIIIKFIFISLVMPSIGYVSGSTNTFDFLKGNLTNALLFSIYVIVVGGFSEEIIFRGFYFSQFERWFGTGLILKIVMILTGSLIFGIPHIYQGGFGVLQSMMVGSIYGAMYLLNNKNIWMVMISHAVFDLFSIYIVYSDQSTFFSTLFIN